MKLIFSILLSLLFGFVSFCQLPNEKNLDHSVAREWNELLLESIRKDLARPTVHARNLWHTSVAMYDAWAVYDETAIPFFLGNKLGDYYSEWHGIPVPGDIEDAREEAISFAMYRLLRYRFRISRARFTMYPIYDAFMASQGYNINFTSVDYSTGSAAALGNYIAQELITFGQQDGSNEENDYENVYYNPSNPPLVMDLPGNPDIDDLNRWQPLFLDVFIDQSGNPIPGNSPEFLSPEWGIVPGFALKDEDLNLYERDGFEYKVFHDPGAPPYIDTGNVTTEGEYYKWAFALVSKWSSHLDPANPEIWDISPASIGNLSSFPTNEKEMMEFYDDEYGGDGSPGHKVNPVTGLPYEPQYVLRADYARVLAEFWADGPDSETPPGHWFTLLNYVSDHPLTTKKFEGEGKALTDLEWDVKAYFLLGGAMHDAAVTAWGCKGWYDYIRPVSALRAMAEFGQSSDPSEMSYHISGIPLSPGYIELVKEGDPMAGAENVNVGKIKVMAWKGPDYIDDPDTDFAGVDWILAENWWPYQRPTFVTPPFAGYVSGHSTFSRAAAEVMTLLTGDAYFPGGMGEFVAPKNEFLVFEEGPSETLTLQWATFRDASDQCSLSRIWGGIHPPVDDIPGRIMGEAIGIDAFELGIQFINGEICEPTLNVVGNPIVQGSYRSIVQINTSGSIASNTTVKFESGQNVIFEPEFQIDNAGLFSVVVKSCDN